jgi:hypothetical protein
MNAAPIRPVRLDPNSGEASAIGNIVTLGYLSVNAGLPAAMAAGNAARMAIATKFRKDIALVSTPAAKSD